MLIPRAQAESFHVVYPALLGFVAGKVGGVNGIASVEALQGCSTQDYADIRDVLAQNLDLISAFCDENPAELSPEWLVQIAAWRHLKTGTFIIERDLKKHTIFLNSGDPPTAYGVLGLTTEIVDMLHLRLPVMVEATLLPWQNNIICDGLIRSYNLIMGGGVRRSYRAVYNEAKSRGVVTSLDPMRPAAAKRAVKRPKTPVIQRFMKRCPRTVEDFIEQYGEPHTRMAGAEALAHDAWGIDGRPVFPTDTLMFYGNILRGKALYVHAKGGAITHLSAVDQITWTKHDRRPIAGRRLLS